MIRILIVDDSPTEVGILTTIFSQEKDLQVIGHASNGKEAIAMTRKLRPDLITMDIQMPVMNGFEATQAIMSEIPTPIVVISTKADDVQMNTTFRALAAGALSVLGKPIDICAPNFEQLRKSIVQTIRVMAGVKVIKRRTFGTQKKINLDPAITAPLVATEAKSGAYKIIAIGASVGGPAVLDAIFSQLPANFPVPIVVVQHISEGFISGFAQWLSSRCKLTVKLAENNEILKSGTIYLAPDGFHLHVQSASDYLSVSLRKGMPISGFCPSITVMFNSLAKACGSGAVGALLTGMGHDGAHGLLDMKKVGAHTFIQDPDTAVVFGMAGVAQALGAVDKVVEASKIAQYLIKITS